jgi:hypothetical protein
MPTPNRAIRGRRFHKTTAPPLPKRCSGTAALRSCGTWRPGDSRRGLFYVARRLQSSAGHIPNDVARKIRTQQALKA